MNLTMQKNILSTNLPTSNFSKLNQEKVKMMLMINDQYTKNNLQGMAGCKIDKHFLMQEISTLGICEVKVNTFFVKVAQQTGQKSTEEIQANHFPETSSGLAYI